jgi:hypothetical protein
MSNVQIHRYESTGEAYDDSQCNEDIHDGDVLVVASEGVVGILVKAWPIAITEARGAFHFVKDGDTVSRFVTDEYPDTDYSASLALAQAEADTMPKPMAPPEPIQVLYQAIDGYSETRGYATVEAAREWPQRMIGAHPDMGSHYAVSFDGVGKVSVAGCTLDDLFPPGDR